MADVATTGVTMASPAKVLASVGDYYGKVLASTQDLKTGACTACKSPPAHVRGALQRVPTVVTEKFYGCGNPLPDGIEGMTVLDLGCGSGRDCYVAAQLVGKSGRVFGVDMTEELLEVARSSVAPFASANPDAAPLSFLRGFIEDLAGAGIKPASIDLAISNCVVNLSPNKRAVLQGVYNALKPGGEFHFSDVYCDRRLPESVRKHEVLLGECFAGALYVNDFISLARQIGFTDVRRLSVQPTAVGDPQLAKVLGAAKFSSITFRLFKLADLDDQCEDYGQIAVYQGTVRSSPFVFTLDDHHEFEKGKPVLVCGNTAAMLSETWLRPHFNVTGTKDVHFGAFPCGPASTSAAASAQTSPSAADESSCGQPSACSGCC